MIGRVQNGQESESVRVWINVCVFEYVGLCMLVSVCSCVVCVVIYGMCVILYVNRLITVYKLAQKHFDLAD